MQQSYWHLTGNLWALSLSTAIALFLPEFGQDDIMSGGVGVVIRTTMVAPIVFSLLYWTGQLITYLVDKLRRWWLMSILMAGIEEGIRNAAERRAKGMAKEMAEEMAKRIVEEAAQAAAEAQADAEKQAQAKKLERVAIHEFMRGKGVSDEEIDAFFHRLNH